MIFTIVLAIIIIIIIMFVFVFYLQWSVCRYDKIDSSIDETEKNNLQSILTLRNNLILFNLLESEQNVRN